MVAPKVEIPAAQDGETATAQVRQRMAQHQAMARDGFTQVEKKDDGSFWRSTRPATKSTSWLAWRMPGELSG